MPRRAKSDLLGWVLRVWVLRVIGRDQRRHIDQIAGLGGKSGTWVKGHGDHLAWFRHGREHR